MKGFGKFILYIFVFIAIVYIIFYRSSGSSQKILTHESDRNSDITSGKKDVSHPNLSKDENYIYPLDSNNNLDFYHNCPLEGTAKRDDVKELNLLKNRYIFPKKKDFDSAITLKSLLQPGNDKERWNTNKAAKIYGYVIEVKPGGVETCNCKTKEIDDRDTHIELVLNPMDESHQKRFVVEITPRMRYLMKQKGLDWRTSSIRDHYLGRWIIVEGWMLLDKEHLNQAENTNPGRERNWRATAWEIHPVTNIKIIEQHNKQ